MKIGLEKLLMDPESILGKARVGLLANPSSVDARLEHAVDLLHQHPKIDLVRLFGPEHGLRSTAQYMVDVGDNVDPVTGLLEISLYGKTFASLAPTPEHLAPIDVLLIDIQDVGARYYTYAATMALAMRIAASTGTQVMVLDRPNPIGGHQVEGGGLQPGLENFCGLYAVPQRHGMTIGELARLYNEGFGIGCDLRVVPCEGWNRRRYYDTLGRPWVMPSPNMPTLETAIVYPGMCLLEGTNVSEGRGTTRPFEIFGAPFIDGRALSKALQGYDLPGVICRPCHFQPTFDKFAGELCEGVQLHLSDRTAFMSYRTGVAIVHAVKSLWPQAFKWRQEPYEFRDDVPAIDLLTGDPRVRQMIDALEDFESVMRVACSGTQQYEQYREAALLYG
ncbi:MAG: DUF1343 domain-containing protein [Myxococcota bacterium]